METLIERYNALHKQVVNEVGAKRKAEVDDLSSDNEAAEFLTFSKDQNWKLVHDAIYVIEIAEVVKKNFVQFGLGRASTVSDIGERYLRLYGLLSAVHQQKLAIEILLAVYQMEEREKIASTLTGSPILQLWKKLTIPATHKAENWAESDDAVQFYEVSRTEVEFDKVKLIGKNNESESYDLFEDLKTFNKKVELTLSFMVEKMMKNFYP